MKINMQLEKEMAMYFDETFDCDNEKNRKIRRKLDELDNFDFIENFDELKGLAVQNYGLINNRMRKRVWELLILNSNDETRIVYREMISKRFKEKEEILLKKILLNEKVKKKLNLIDIIIKLKWM